jgi:uncharacterized protein (TIGR00369 family)
MTSNLNKTTYFGLTIPFLAHLGVVPEYAEGGKSRISLVIQPEFENSFQIAHGGVVMTLLDFAMGAAARSTVNQQLGAMTIDMNVSFLRPSVGKIAVEGSVLKFGKTIYYCEAIVLNEAGEVTAKSSGTFMLRR